MVEQAEKNWYDKAHKKMLIVPVLMLIFSLFYIFNFYQEHGDFIRKDVSLTGGTTISVFDTKADAEIISVKLKNEFPDIKYRTISDFRSGQQKGFSLETTADAEKITDALEKELGYKLTTDNSSVEFSGASLSAGFYKQLINAIIAAFLLMSWVVFIIFSSSWKERAISSMLTFSAVSIALNEVSWIKIFALLFILTGGAVYFFSKNARKNERIIALCMTIALILLLYIYPKRIFVLFFGIALISFYIYKSIPSFAVILAAFADILMTLVVVDMLGMSISGAGIIAFLMLIGYSVDTDILLTTRMLKGKEGSLNQRLFEAFKTGMTMTLTAIAAVGVSLIVVYSFSDTLKQIFEIILIGLGFDIINTWISNASLLKWFMEAKKLT